MLKRLNCLISAEMRNRCVFAEEKAIPTFEVSILSPRIGGGQEFCQRVGVVDELPIDLIIGNKFFRSRPDFKGVVRFSQTELPDSTDRANDDSGTRRWTWLAYPLDSRRRQPRRRSVRSAIWGQRIKGYT